MAKPIAVTSGDQQWAFDTLPKLMTFNGAASYDPDDDAITDYLWTLIDRPPGSAAAIATPTASETTLTADVPGTYLLMLQVTAGGEASDTDVLTAPPTAFARLRITTEHRQLVLPAEYERGWTDRMNANLAKLDVLGGDFDTHAALGSGQHWPKASAAAIGASKLSAAPADAATPIAVGKNDPAWTTLTGGGNADPLHTHAGGGGWVEVPIDTGELADSASIDLDIELGAARGLFFVELESATPAAQASCAYFPDSSFTSALVYVVGSSFGGTLLPAAGYNQSSMGATIPMALRLVTDDTAVHLQIKNYTGAAATITGRVIFQSAEPA